MNLAPRWAAICLALGGVASATQAQGANEGAANPGPARTRPASNPGAVVAADLAFNRLSQDKGHWAALRESAAPAAEFFAPMRVSALAWLKDRSEPANPVQRRPNAVWSSCDGSIAASTGEWRRGEATGVYATLWQRQPKGELRWLLTMDLATEARAASEMIAAAVGDCSGPALPVSPGLPLQAGDDVRTGVSRDGSLRWTSARRADGTLRFMLDLRRDGEARQVLDLSGPPAS